LNRAWAWLLVPVDGERTRVVSRLGCRHQPGTVLGLAGALLMELGTSRCSASCSSTCASAPSASPRGVGGDQPRAHRPQAQKRPRGYPSPG